MHIAILTLGTLGDVLPFVRLGKALRSAGHSVTLSTGKTFESLAREHGLDFVPVEADFRQMVNSEEGRRMMKTPFQTKKNLRSHVYPMLRDALYTFFSLSNQADKVIFHSKTLADCFADRFPEKMIRANVVPAFEATRAFPNPVTSGFPLPPFLNRFSYRFSNLVYRVVAEPMRQLRQEAGLPLHWQFQELTNIYGISEHYLPRPADFGPQSYFTGFWYEPSVVTLPPDLVNFLQNGPPPVLLTFGSMPYRSSMNLEHALHALTQKLNIRLLVAEGWGLHHLTALEENPSIKIMPYIPYDAVLPQVKAVIHHGGIGTIAACLHAGKPFLPCPAIYPWGDQYFWSEIGYRKGVALKPVPLKKLTTEKLIQLTRRLITGRELYTHAARMQEKLCAENGLSNAVRVIESIR